MAKVLFVASGYARAGWYRCVLPAMFGGWDWAGVVGSPPGFGMTAGWVHQSTQYPDFTDYDVVVLQQVRGLRWLDFIKKLQTRGIRVLYEIDDYIHGIRRADDHDFRSHYSKDSLREWELPMRACDGLIVSTDRLKELYAQKTDRPIYVCENGLDLGRYRLSRPPRGDVAGRETVTILWSGATGHTRAAAPWLQSVAEVMRDVEHASFVSVGQDFAASIAHHFPDRAISIPFTSLECYPAAMTLGDVSIAPAGNSEWYQAKSDLRAMESQALGIPIVADRHYERSVLDGETGFVVSNPSQARAKLRELVSNDELRLKFSDAAREYATREFSMESRVGAWIDAIGQAAERPPVREVKYPRD